MLPPECRGDMTTRVSEGGFALSHLSGDVMCPAQPHIWKADENPLLQGQNDVKVDCVGSVISHASVQILAQLKDLGQVLNFSKGSFFMWEMDITSLYNSWGNNME